MASIKRLIEAAHIEGQDAFERGDELYQNPYNRLDNEALHYEWRAGWYYAKNYHAAQAREKREARYRKVAA